MKFRTLLLALLPLQIHAAIVGSSSRHVNLRQKEMPVTNHNKTAGDGYNKGSPLYNLQEKREKEGKAAEPEPAPTGATLPAAVPAGTPTMAPTASLAARNFAGFMYLLSYVSLCMFVGLIWMKCAGGRYAKGYDERPNKESGFTYGLFSTDHCCYGGDHHVHVCLCSWFCTPLRMADTYSKEPFALIPGFFLALFLVSVFGGISYWFYLVFGGAFNMIFNLAVLVYFRQKMRAQYGIRNGTCLTLCEDCVTWLFCSFCAVAQEARQAEFCKKLGDDSPDEVYDPKVIGQP